MIKNILNKMTTGIIMIVNKKKPLKKILKKMIKKPPKNLK